MDPFAQEEDRPVSTSLVKRAKKRRVAKLEDRKWRVEGNESLGDQYDYYTVMLPEGSQRYTCDCYHTHHGDSRAKKMCSHVMAVVLARRGEMDYTDMQLPLTEGTVGHSLRKPVNASPISAASSRGAVPSVNDPLWGTPPLPEWLKELRPHQIQAIEEILYAFDNGADIVWLDAPTGTGKTLIAEAVRRLRFTSAAYICSSKSLQDQFLRDYPYSKVLKGRANYPTLDQPFPDYTAADCTKDPTDGPDAQCLWCFNIKECPYEKAKSQALRSPLMVLNTSYFLTEANFVGNVRGRQLGIVDECDVLEQELMGFVEYALTSRMIERLGIKTPDKGARKNTIIEWLEGEVVKGIEGARRKLPRYPERISDVRQVNALKNLYGSTKNVIDDLHEAEENWVRDYGTDKPFALKPIKVDQYGPRFLWAHANKWLCMSATIISPEELSDSLGLQQTELKYETVRVPMTFPVENRRIYAAPVANMVHREKESAWPHMATGIKNVLRRHESERVLIHTVSYDLTKYLRVELASESRNIITYVDARERERAIDWFRATDASVLLAPSLERGIDLKDEDCRVIVVAKIPFPSLNDRQISERMHVQGGQTWYSVQTVRKLVQMTGRGVRSEDDWCVTYILDGQFMRNIWKKNKGLLPEWWREAVDLTFPTRELLK